jgi:hypothetical protein
VKGDLVAYRLRERDLSRLRVSKWEFGGEGEYGAARWAAAESAVGGFWHGPEREGKRERDETPGPGPRGQRGRQQGAGG